MSILYLREHTFCFNYSCGKQAAISNQTIRKGNTWEISPNENILVFILEGELSFSHKEYRDKQASKGKIILLTSNSQHKALAKKDTKFILIKIPTNIQLCDRYSFEQLFSESENQGKEPDLNFLDINKELNGFLKTLQHFMVNGLNCALFFEIKIKELFFIFRGFYTKEELYEFFYPILSNDLTFSEFVKKNYKQVKTVKELASLANYSLSGFVKRFKKVFGTSAYQWMKEQKATYIYREINDKTKTLKEISSEYGFSSPAHFNEFCKIHFGNTPGNIRKNKDD